MCKKKGESSGQRKPSLHGDEMQWKTEVRKWVDILEELKEMGVGNYHSKLTICTLKGGQGILRGRRGREYGVGVKQRVRENVGRWGRGNFYRYSGEGEAWLKESTPLETNKILF